MSGQDQLDSDLRRLLSADQLDLPVRPDASTALRGRVALRRRRRTQARSAGLLASAVLVGVVAVNGLPQVSGRNAPAVTGTHTTSGSPTPSSSSTPSTTTSAPRSSSPSSTGAASVGATGEALLSHGRYGPLHVGLSLADVRASDWLVDLPATLPPPPAGRRCAGWYRDKEGRAAVFVSERGIEAMVFSRGVHTISDVAIGDPWAKVFSIYKAQGLKGEESGDTATLALQGKPAAQLRFVREYDDTVGQIAVERVDQDCYD